MKVSAQAGAWLREPGEIYSKVSLSRLTARRIFAAKREERLPADKRTDDALGLYGEYGMNDRWTVIGSAEARRAERDVNGPALENAGPADAWLSVKRGVLRAPFVMSVQAGVKVPLGYSRAASVPLGDGQFDYEARLLTGKGSARAYGGAEIAYRKRCGDFSDELPYRLEAGIWAPRRVLFKLTLDGVQNRTNDSASTTPVDRRAANLFDKEYMDFTPALAVFFEDGFGFEIFYRETIAGANASIYQGWGIGVSWQGRPGVSAE